MIFYSTRKKIKIRILENYNFYKTLILTQFTSEYPKKVFMDIEGIALNRYLYNFIKYFTLNGYTVYIPRNKKIISTLNRKKGEFVYSSWILEEQVKLGKPEKADIVITSRQLSNDYFGGPAENTYHVPMSQYPGMYRHHIHVDRKEINKKRKRSVFMSGNIDTTYYTKISKAGFFDIPNRSEVTEFIQTKPYYYKIFNRKTLNGFISGKKDNKVIIIDTSKHFRIPLNELKKLLQGFHFYLALPGIFIPQSHNLIEAMSVGCIPVIHKTYADHMCPVLTNNETAIIYESLHELNDLIHKLFNFKEPLLYSLHGNVREYYDSYLSPSAVVKNIENNEFSNIYIQAENISLNFLNKRK